MKAEAQAPLAAAPGSAVSPIQLRALKILAERAMTCTELGHTLWCEPGRWVTGASQGGNRWTRNAGRVVNAMLRKGLVKWRQPYSRRTEWVPTQAGIDVIGGQSPNATPSATAGKEAGHGN